MRIKVSDFVAEFLACNGARQVFMVTGGGAMHLNHAFSNNPKLQVSYLHHEQACSMAAEGYARIDGHPAIVNVTTGPGVINALNGVFGAFTDSIPMIVISGQVRSDTCRAFYPELNMLRQLGDQEADNIALAKPVSKWCAMATRAEDIPALLNEAWIQATTGRPGPAWLDIPIDIQGAWIELDDAHSFSSSNNGGDTSISVELLDSLLNKLKYSKRPVIMVGTGVRLAGVEDILLELVEFLGLPVVTAWTHDLISSDHPLFCGRPGTIGTRAGNFVVQNADLVLVLGSRLNIRQTGYNFGRFAGSAEVVQVDVDNNELIKPTFKPDWGLCLDLRYFIPFLLLRIKSKNWKPSGLQKDWLKWCKERMDRYPIVNEKQRIGQAINPYYFIEELGRLLESDAIVVSGNASACIVPFQSLFLKAGQRLFSNSGSASMGYDLPAAIGAALADRSRQVVCLAGDGSLQMNIQELQSIHDMGLNIKVIVLENGGYLSIQQTQMNFFGKTSGTGAADGVGFPDFCKVAMAYGINSIALRENPFHSELFEFLSEPGPGLCVVHLDRSQEFEPRIRSRVQQDGSIVSPDLDDMYPFLSEDELNSNRING